MLLALRSALRSVAATPALRFSLWLTLAAVAVWPALAQVGGMNTHYDAQFLAAYERHARIAVLQYGQLPLWDPYSCGGLYGLAAPQTRYASPFFLLTLLFGVELAGGLLAVLLPALGMEGMYRYARSWGARSTPSLLCAPLFPLTGFFGFAWGFGWLQFLSFCLVPWILTTLRAALRGERRGAYACAVWVGITVGIGGTYTLPMLVLPGLCELGSALGGQRMRSADRGTHWRIALGGASATALLVASICAYRLWPLLESTGATLRTLGGQPERSLGWLARSLFLFADPVDQVPGRYFVPPLIAISLWTLCRRRALALWILAAVSFALAFGHAGPYAPFSLMRELPIYGTLRHPERFLLLFVLAMGVLCALALSDLLARVRRGGGPRWHAGALVAVAVLFTAGTAAQVHSGHTQYGNVETEPIPPSQSDTAFRQARGNRWLIAHLAPEGLGSLGCGEAYPVPMSRRLRGDLAQEEYLVTPAGAPSELGRAERLYWSPNRIDVRVSAPRPLRLAVNQNYHPGWTTSVGQVESWEGLLSVRLPAGEHLVRLRFLPRSGVGGLAVTLLGLITGAVYAFARRTSPGGVPGFCGAIPARMRRRGRPRGADRRRRPAESCRKNQGHPLLQRALLLGAGPLGIATLLVAWPEPRFERPLPRTPDHEPIYLRALPDDARRLDVRFDVPLTLVGARLPPDPLPPDTRHVEVELLLRRTGELGAEHALFVHFRGPRGRSFGADHAVLSGVLYLPRMPLDSLVRDRFVVPLPPRATGRWRMTVGLYDAFGDGSRREIVQSAPGVEVDANAVVVGELHVAGRAAPGP